jgi:hypothetical protein
MTVFTFSEPEWAAKHNDVYWDDAELALATGVLSVSPAGGFTLFAQLGAPGEVQGVLQITAPDGADWEATLEPGGTFTPTLQPQGDRLLISVISAPYGLGTYSAEVTLTTDPPAANGAVSVPITLRVVPEVRRAMLPLVSTP